MSGEFSYGPNEFVWKDGVTNLTPTFTEEHERMSNIHDNLTEEEKEQYYRDLDGHLASQ